MSLVNAYKQCIVNTCIRLHREKQKEPINLLYSNHKQNEEFVSQIPRLLKNRLFDPIDSYMDKAKKELLKEVAP